VTTSPAGTAPWRWLQSVSGYARCSWNRGCSWVRPRHGRECWDRSREHRRQPKHRRGQRHIDTGRSSRRRCQARASASDRTADWPSWCAAAAPWGARAERRAHQPSRTVPHLFCRIRLCTWLHRPGASRFFARAGGRSGLPSVQAFCTMHALCERTIRGIHCTVMPGTWQGAPARTARSDEAAPPDTAAVRSGSRGDAPRAHRLPALPVAPPSAGSGGRAGARGGSARAPQRRCQPATGRGESTSGRGELAAGGAEPFDPQGPRFNLDPFWRGTFRWLRSEAAGRV
jgi:hypothetical protein